MAARFSGAVETKIGECKPGIFSGFAEFRIVGGKREAHWTGKVELIEEKLLEPLKRRKWARKFAQEHGRKPRCFANSMSDMFHEKLPDETIDKIFAAMALCPEIDFMALTKRADRMELWGSDKSTPFRVQKAMDTITVQIASEAYTEQIVPIEGYPGYFISNFGTVLSGSGSVTCIYCGTPCKGSASKRYCSNKCRQNSFYHRSRSPHPKMDPHGQQLKQMSPDEGPDGHQRVMLYRDGVSSKELVHRLVLAAFDRKPEPNEQACHRDGNPKNNHMANLRWGTQSDNWDDRRRHGNGHSRGARYLITPEIEWPLSNVMLGVSVEDQKHKYRIDHLRRTPAAVRFISVEPMLESIDLQFPNPYRRIPGGYMGDRPDLMVKPNWVVCGGESGHDARPFDLAWARDLRDQCRAAGVSFFFKQAGSQPYTERIQYGVGPWGPAKEGIIEEPVKLKARNGNDPAEWPEDLRIQEFPESVATSSR